MTINNGHLNSEEYTALRKVLGFSQSEAQQFHGLKDVSTVKRWENGRNTTSGCACAKMLKLSADVFDYLRSLFFEFRHHRTQPAIFLSYSDDEDGAYINPLLDFFPSLRVYKMTIYRAYVEAIERKLDAHIVLFDSIEYNRWRVAHNLTDSLKAREDWAKDYYMQKNC